MRSVALALLLALPVGAQERTALEVERGRLELKDKRQVDVGEGLFLDPFSAMEAGKELRELKAENEALRAAPTPAPLAVLGVAVVCLVLGFAGGVYAVVRLR